MARNLLLSALVLFTACVPTVSWDDEFDLRVGDAIRTPTATVAFIEVIRDSRCPPWADCVSDERVALRLRVTVGETTSDHVLEGVLIPAGDHPRFPIVELPDGSWLTLVDMTFGNDPAATLLIHGPPQM